MNTPQNSEDDASAPVAGATDAPENPRFLYYFVMWDKGTPSRPKIVEAIMVERHGPNPKKVPFDTGIQIPELLRERMRAVRVEEEVKAFCTRLRTELSRTARIRVARNAGPTGVLAHYRYRLDEAAASVEIPEAAIPREIADVIRGDVAFEEDERYMKWYWSTLDRLRDEQITKELKRHYAQEAIESIP